jgi:hypothetical protein
MTEPIRRLNGRGRDAFRAWLEGGGEGAPPLDLLDDPETSLPLHPATPRPTEVYERRYDLGVDLVNLLDDIEVAWLQIDAGLWDWLSLCLIDQICPPDGTGRRKLSKIAHYILEIDDHRRRYRHLVRTAWALVQVHGTVAEYLLAGPLHVHSEIVEQLSAYHDVITCKPLIAAMGHLVWDKDNARLKRGFRGHGPGSARRVQFIAKQFRLTYDLDSMRPEQILNLLPREFDRFRTGPHPPDRRPGITVGRDRHEGRPEANQT